MTVTLVTPRDDAGLPNKSLVSDELWARLVGRILKDLEFQHRFADEDDEGKQAAAELVMDGALGYLTLCADGHRKGYNPSRLVDIGWHTFILYTQEYAEFCHRIAGRFIHHVPSDAPGINYGPRDIRRTVEALRQHGIMANELVWDLAAVCEDPDGGDCCDGCDPNKKDE